MSGKTNTSMFDLAHKRTLDSIKYFIYQEQIKTDELKHLSNEILDNARMELFAAKVENVSIEFLSNPAKELSINPEFVLTNEFRAKLFVADKDSQDTTVDEFTTEIFSTSGKKSEAKTTTDDKTEEIFIEVQDKPKEPEASETAKPKAIVKSFTTVKPGHLPKSASKKYRASILKACRDVLYEIVLNYAMEQLGILSSQAVTDPQTLATVEQRLANSSMVGTLLLSMTQGKDIDSLPSEQLQKEVALTKEIDALSYTILDNAEEFRQDNPAIVTGKELTVSDIKRYYKELGNPQQDAKGTSNAGKQVIVEALTPEVYAVLDNSTEMQL